MNNILKSTVLLLVCFCTNAQTKNIDKGNKQYESLAYIEAAKTYERLAEKGYKSVDLFQRLGNSYYFNGKLKEAKRWYKCLFELSQKVEPEYYYRYAQTLKAGGDYLTADKYLSLFQKMSSNDSRAILYQNQKDYKEVIEKNSGRYEVKNTDINSRMSDYGSAIFGDKLVFATSRDTIGFSKVKTKWTSHFYTNLYIANRAVDGTLSNPKLFSKLINSKFHEDTPVFTKDLKTVYFTRNNYLNGKIKRDEDKVILLKLYKATLIDGKWRNIIELPFNSDQYSVAHPALSPDEKTLYFASNMPGTKGQSDIYKVSIKGDNTYGTPENLGLGINTEGRETFPFVSAGNELYFASDGHQGLGGLDIFVKELSKNDGPIINIGTPINGPMDDFAFLIDNDSKIGYFSSNRDGGLGLDDIYSFKEIKSLEFNIKHDLVGVVTNSDTSEILPNAKVTIYDENFTPIQEVLSDEKGNYNFSLEPGKKYYVRAEKDNYETIEVPVSIPFTSGKTRLPITTNTKVSQIRVGLDLAKIFEIKAIYFDLDKYDIRKDAAYELEKILDVMEQYPNLKVDVRSHTDSRQSANYNEKLSDNRAKATAAWLIEKGISANRLTSKGYGESQLINKCTDGVKCSEEEHQINRRSEFIVISM